MLAAKLLNHVILLRHELYVPFATKRDVSLTARKSKQTPVCLQGKGAPLMLSSIFEAVMRAFHWMKQWL